MLIFHRRKNVSQADWELLGAGRTTEQKPKELSRDKEEGKKCQFSVNSGYSVQIVGYHQVRRLKGKISELGDIGEMTGYNRKEPGTLPAHTVSTLPGTQSDPFAADGVCHACP